MSGGRPEHEPTDQLRQLVQVLRSCGIPINTIARNVKLDIRTLKKHYKDELKHGAEQVTAALSASVIRAGLNGDWRAALSWLARFGGPQWRTQTRADTDGPASLAGSTTIIIRGGLPPVLHSAGVDADQDVGGSELDDIADLDPFASEPAPDQPNSKGTNGSGHPH